MTQPETDRVVTAHRTGLPIQITALTAIVALALGLIAGAAAALYQRTKPTKYQSVAILLIDQPTAIANAQDDGPLLKLQQLRYFYAGLLQTDVIADPVAQHLHVPVSDVKNHLTGFVDPTSFTLGIAATATSSLRSSQLAQAATSALTSYVVKQQTQLGLTPINQVVLDEVTTPHFGVKVRVSNHRVFASAAIAFIIVAAGFVIIADLSRRRW